MSAHSIVIISDCALISKGLTCIIQISTDGSVLGYDSEGRAIVVCDSHGPWAVDVTDYME